MVRPAAASSLPHVRATRGERGSRAVQAGSKPIFPEFLDPETGDVLPQPAFESAAVAPDGTVYIAFEDSRSASSGAIGVVRSLDGGLTWSSMTLPGVSAFAFEPAIAVDQHGTVGVIWYDLRNDVPGDAGLTADVWFAHSDDRGTSWRQTHLAGPTDIRTGPIDNNRVGEYQGLAGLRRRLRRRLHAPDSAGEGRAVGHLLRANRARSSTLRRRAPRGWRAPSRRPAQRRLLIEVPAETITVGMPQ